MGSLGRAVVLVLVTVSLEGCVSVRPRTEVIVEIAAEPGVAANADALLVSVLGGPAAGPLAQSFSDAVTPPSGSTTIAFPVRLTVIPVGEDASRIFEISVAARDPSGIVIGRQRVQGTYFPGRTTFVRLLLEDCCRAVARTCSPMETCRSCACEPVGFVDPADDAGTHVGQDAGPSDAHVPEGTDAFSHDASSTGCVAEPDCPPRPCQRAACRGGGCVYESLCAPGESCCGDVCGANCDCMRIPRGRECRPAAAGMACDVAEVCDGSSPACPPDGFADATVVCRAATTECDASERCSGFGAACPTDVLAPVTTPCSTGICDGMGMCVTGCPHDAPCSTGDACRLGRTDCTSGSPVCVDAGPAPTGTVCRAAAGACDVAETCTADGSCPANGFRPSTDVCRPSAGPCDPSEHCAGAADCPSDQRAGPPTTCRAAAGLCDRPEGCNGVDATCPPDQFAPSTFTCDFPLDSCSSPAMCSGTSAECPAPTTLPPGSPCDAPCGGACTATGFCLSTCRSPNFCCVTTGGCLRNPEDCPFG